MSGTTTERNRVPIFDGKAESYDKWEIQWNAFVEVEGISCALSNTLDTNMPASSAIVVSTTYAQVKLQAAAIKANKKAIEYLVLAFKSTKLLRLLTKAKTVEWPEGEAWRVKKSLQESIDQMTSWQLLN